MSSNDENALISAEDIFDVVHEALIILDDTMHVISANKSFYEKFKITSFETERKLIFDLGNGQWNIPQLHLLLEEIIPQKNQFFNIEVNVRFESIGDKVLLLNGRRILGEEGRAAHVLLAIDEINEKSTASLKNEDLDAKYTITEQKRITEEHERQRTLLEQIINEVPFGIALHEGPEFVTTLVNPGYYKFAYGKGDIKGKRIADIWPELKDQIIPPLKRVYETGEPYHGTDVEFTVVRGMGPEKAWFSFNFLPFYGEKDKITALLVWAVETTQDVLARKALETSRDQIKKQREFFGNVLANARVAIAVLKGTDLRFTYVNPSYQAMCPDLLMVGKIYQEVFPEAAEGGTLENMLRVLRTGEPWIIQRYSAPVPIKSDAIWDGQVIRLEPAPGENEPSLLSIVWDVTESNKAELNLRKSEERLVGVLESMPDAFVSFDQDLHFTYVNRNAEHIQGARREDLLGKDAREIYSDSESYKTISQYERVLKEQKPITLTTYHAGFDMWFEVRGFPTPDGVSVFFKNISEQIKAEKARRESEDSYRSLFESIDEGFCIIQVIFDDRGRSIDHRFLEVNPALERHTGFVNARGKTAREFVPDLEERWFELYGRVALTGEPQRFVNESKAMGRWFEVYAFRVGRPQERKVALLFSDISERKQLEEQLKRERELLRTIIESIPVMITLYDPQLQKIQINKAFECITGWTIEDARKEDLMKIIYPDPLYRTIVVDFMESLSPGFKDFQMVGKNGEIIESSWANIKLPDGRQVGIGIDIRERLKAENDLRVSAERFMRITSANIIGVIIGDINGRLVYVNDYYLNSIGYSRVEFEKEHETLQKTSPQELLPLEDNVKKELLERGSVSPYEKELIRKDGSKAWVLIASAMLPGPGDEIFSFVLDISIRKYALEEALARHAEIEAILNSFPDGYAVFNQNGTIRMMNTIARSILKYPDNIAQVKFELQLENLNPLTSNGDPFPFGKLPFSRALCGEIVQNVVIKIRRDEKDVWIAASGSPIMIKGQIQGAVAQISDITKLHDLQEQLAGERNFVSAILETSGALIMVIGNNGEIVRFNRACELLTGYKISEVSGHSVFDLFILDVEKEDIKKVIARLFAGEPIVEFENHWKTRLGENRFIRWRNTPLRDDRGLVTFAVATGIDITDRKKLEEQLNHRADELVAINADLESFSYSISHDLRNPLKVIDGFSTILIEDYADRLDDEGRDYLKRILDSTRKAMLLITDILNLSRVGKHEIKLEDIDISTTVQLYIDELKSSDPGRKIQCVIQKGVHAYADPHLVHIALENLLRNAWKFSSKKETALIEFTTDLLDEKTVYIIKDNGAGFDSEFAEAIFEPFKRVHSEKEFGGTGIGLSIVKRVVSRHGGDVWAEGEVGKGAVFYFTLS